MNPLTNNPALHNKGTSMIEVLVTLVIVVIGLLGLAGLQLKTQQVEMESYQRTQAMVILNDMVSRLSANMANGADYVTVDAGAAIANCGALVGAAFDLCEWGNTLGGAGETSGGNNLGAMIGARGCITEVQAPAACTPGIYDVAVAWQGLFETVAPNNNCAAGEYGNDSLRRAISIRAMAGSGTC